MQRPPPIAQTSTNSCNFWKFEVLGFGGPIKAASAREKAFNAFTSHIEEANLHLAASSSSVISSEADVLIQKRNLDIEESVVDLEYLKFMERVDPSKMNALQMKLGNLKRTRLEQAQPVERIEQEEEQEQMKSKRKIKILSEFFKPLTETSTKDNHPSIATLIIRHMRHYVSYALAPEDVIRHKCRFGYSYNQYDCMAAMDGIFIPIKRPEFEGESYYSGHKKTYGMTMLEVVDSDRKFLYVNCGNTGRASDSMIFQTCQFLVKKLEF